MQLISQARSLRCVLQGNTLLLHWLTITVSLNVIGAAAALFFTNHSVEYVMGWCNRTVGCNWTPKMGQLKQPIIFSPFSQIHQPQN